MKTNEERAAAYAICRERGHVDSGVLLTSMPPWNVCKHCGTNYRHTQPELVEQNPPILLSELDPEDVPRPHPGDDIGVVETKYVERSPYN